MSIDFGQSFSLWTVRLAVLCWFAFAWILIGELPRRGSLEKPKTERRVSQIARWLWILATALLAIHIVTAFAFFHQWSHAVAATHTAERTEEFTGLYWSGGIWLNYLLLVVCLYEAHFWFWNPNKILARDQRWNWIVYGFVLFMVFNAGVVFVTGPARWVNLTGFLFLSWRAKATSG